MKRSILFALLITMPSSFLWANNESDNEVTNCCGLGDTIYALAKRVGRNDFLYLAHANSLWFLKKKVQLSDHADNIDKYYMRAGRYVEGYNISIFHTPLHEAISQGHFEAVRFFCCVGNADITKKIKSAPDIQLIECATEPHPCLSLSSWSAKGRDEGKIKEEIENTKKTFHVGLSALDLAEQMLKEADDKQSERKKIVNFLIGIS